MSDPRDYRAPSVGHTASEVIALETKKFVEAVEYEREHVPVADVTDGFLRLGLELARRRGLVNALYEISYEMGRRSRAAEQTSQLLTKTPVQIAIDLSTTLRALDAVRVRLASSMSEGRTAVYPTPAVRAAELIDASLPSLREIREELMAHYRAGTPNMEG